LETSVYWPDAQKFLKIAQSARDKYGVDLWFIDGNHEHFPKLRRDVRAAQAAAGVPEGNRDPVELAPGFVYLPRGSRISVAGRSAVCVGGAASIDRTERVEGKDWFPEERVNDADIEAVAAGGHADLLITHDAPSGWDIPGLPPDSQRPNSWILEMASCDEHRERMREVLELATPSWLVHGHYHAAYEKTHEETWGGLKTYGLDRNRHNGWGVIVCEVDGELSFRWIDAAASRTTK
jgi:hypothetical protein